MRFDKLDEINLDTLQELLYHPQPVCILVCGDKFKQFIKSLDKISNWIDWYPQTIQQTQNKMCKLLQMDVYFCDVEGYNGLYYFEDCNVDLNLLLKLLNAR